MSGKKDHASVKIHPPVLTLIFILIAYVIGRVVVLPVPLPPILRNIGLGLAGLGLVFGLLAFREFMKARKTLDPHSSVTTIVSSGIYRFTRNPIYLGFLCMLIGFPLTFGNFWGFILAPMFIWFMNHLVIEHEEAYLEKKFGEAYTSYKSRVRRWL